MRFLKTTVFFFVCFGTLSPLFAGEAPQLRFRAFSLKSAINELGLVSAKGLIECDIPSHRRSVNIDYFGGSVLRFVDKNAYTLGEPLPPSLAEVSVPKGMRQPLFLFFESKKSTGMKYQVMVVEDSIKDMPGGSSMFVNLSPSPMVLLFGEKGKTKVKLKPRSRSIQKFPAENRNVKVRVAIYVDGSVKKGMDSRIFPAKTHRDIYFIYPVGPKYPGKMRMRSLRENEITAKSSRATKADKAKGKPMDEAGG